jgi:hypothetical protein
MSLKTMTTSVEDKRHEAIESEGRQPQFVGAPRVEDIRQRAYEIHLERGGEHGWDQDDWLQAERDLTRRYQTH